MSSPRPGRQPASSPALNGLVALVLLLPPPVNQSPPVNELVRQLDDSSFRARRQAERRLVAAGAKALPALREAVKHPSAEVRVRAMRIIGRIQEPILLGGFSDLVRKERDGRIDVLGGMCLMSQLLDPLVRRDAIERQLDRLADEVRRELGQGVDPSRAEPARLVAALRHVLFERNRFTGNRQNYSHPDNSSLARVLATRKGLPILLSHVVVEVGQRLKVPMVGLGVPGRYMVKYDGSKAPGGSPGQDIILDPFNAGRVVTVEMLKKEIGGRDFDKYLVPVTDRAALARMLSNLRSHLLVVGRTRDAGLVERCIEIVRE